MSCPNCGGDHSSFKHLIKVLREGNATAKEQKEVAEYLEDARPIMEVLADYMKTHGLEGTTTPPHIALMMLIIEAISKSLDLGSDQAVIPVGANFVAPRGGKVN